MTRQSTRTPLTAQGRADLLADLTRAGPDLLDDIREFLARSAREVSSSLDDMREEIEAGTELAFARLVHLTSIVLAGEPLTGGEKADMQDALFAEIGRNRWQQGDDLVALLSAYQSCGRIAWRRLSQAMLGAGEEPETVAAVAEALFFLVDRMSAASAEGFTTAQTEGAANRARLREELVDLLLTGYTDVMMLQAAASRAGWRLPREASLVLLGTDNDISNAAIARLDVDVLPIRREGGLGAIVPNPSAPGRRERLARALKGFGAVVSFPVPLAAIPSSAAIAATAASLSRRGIIADDPLFVADHLDAVIVHRDTTLLEELRSQVLAPLAQAPRVSRTRLVETLASWLRHMGDRQAVASELSIHPQTVRYRLGVLRALFGDDLDDDATRARLMLALAWSPTSTLESAPTSSRYPPTTPPSRGPVARVNGERRPP